MLSKYLQARPGLYVQPRMGMSSLKSMKEGLKAVKELKAPTIGTITLDSYTRMGQLEEARKSIQAGLELNGFPILAYPSKDITAHLSSLADKDFLIQVRHGTANPVKIFERLAKCDILITEGGPVSYCLPYSRSSLKDSIHAWQKSCHILASHPLKSHLESFAGCMLGQLCHPSVLISLGILEALFFQNNGLRDISLSYAQQYCLSQDMAAVSALKRLASVYLAEDICWHIVIYTFMGLFPETDQGYERILKQSVTLALQAGAKRLIVKTPEESFQIPSLSSNLMTLEKAYNFSCGLQNIEQGDAEEEEIIFSQSRSLIDAVLNLDSEIGKGLYKAFQRGYLDVPFCLHPDNCRLATCSIDAKGYLQWVSLGKLPIKLKGSQFSAVPPPLTSIQFLRMLEFNRNKFDIIH